MATKPKAKPASKKKVAGKPETPLGKFGKEVKKMAK